jgi:hypothetical protein
LLSHPTVCFMNLRLNVSKQRQMIIFGSLLTIYYLSPCGEIQKLFEPSS